MKTLIKISLLALGLGVGAIPVLQAADTDAKVERAGRHSRIKAQLKHRAAIRAKVARRLDLTPEQRTQLKADRSKAVNQLKALRADPNLTRDQKRAKARELLESARSELRGALTPEQKSKIEEFRAKRKAKRQGSA